MIRQVDFLLDALVSGLVAAAPQARAGAVVALLALPAGLLVGLVWRLTIPPDVARRTSDRSWARLVGIAVYREEPRALLRAALGLMSASLMRLCLMLPALATAAAVLVLSYPVLDEWFALRPFLPGEEARLSVRFRAGQWGVPGIRTGDGAAVGLMPLRHPEAGEVEWRIACKSEGTTAVMIDEAGTTVQTELRIGSGLCRLRPLAVSSTEWRHRFTHAGGLSTDGPFERVEIHYPSRVCLAVGGYVVPWWGLHLAVMLGVAQMVRLRRKGEP